MIAIPYVVVLGMLGVALCAGSAAALLFCNRYAAQLDARLRDLPGEKHWRSTRSGQAASSSLPTVERNAATLPKKMNRWIYDSDEYRRRQQSRLIQAGIYNPAALFAFLLARTGLTAIPPLVGLLAGGLGVMNFRAGLLWGAAAGVLGMLLPSLWLDSQIRRRHRVFRQSLADFLDLMIVCLESGISLQGTIQRVSDELRIAHPEFAGELNIVQRDIDLGATIDGALRRFAARSGYDAVGSLAKFVREAQRFGTQLTEALRMHADMLRSQRESAAEETAQKAAVKILIPTLLLILPAVFIVLAGPAVIQVQQAFAK